MNCISLITSDVECALLVAQRLKRLPAMRETWVQSLGREDPLEKEMATHSSILAGRIPGTEEPGGLQSTGSQRIGHDWATSLHSTSQCNSDSCTMNCSASKKEQKHAICSSMDATRDYHTKWSKLERERRILYDHHLYVKSKIWHKWTYLQNTLKRHRKQTCGFQGGKERAGEAGEPGISRGKLLHTGRVNSKGYCVAQELYSMFCDKT